MNPPTLTFQLTMTLPSPSPDRRYNFQFINKTLISPLLSETFRFKIFNDSPLNFQASRNCIIQMNYPEFPPYGDGGGDRQQEKRGVQGPRPSPLSLNKASRKIGKPPLPAQPHHASRPPLPPQQQINREPVIIYDVSPKVIHAEASDFLSIVQRLTGLCSSSTTPEITVGGPISPATRLAVLDRASPPDRERDRARAAAIEESELLGMVDTGVIPGILSPAPANLPSITAEMFSPVMDPQTLFGFQDNLMSPWSYGNYFPGSPGYSALFPGATIFSPAPSPVFDFSTLFDS